MERTTAVRVESAMRAVAAQIDETIRIVMDECDQEEFERFRAIAAQLMGDIFCDVLSPIYEAHPELTPLELKN
ncbi:MAG: hypothetical protein ISS15_04015 [Alphaproteobacteria bacterium]|nr:hypothetical protein [Alphaproteobacteria bacterium]MBL6939286.1 hypothetical protein [Alphaproteobacteria bacterium]MBL7096802.1 hypothetical protein [Alphaproteobacteria bacterium]